MTADAVRSLWVTRDEMVAAVAAAGTAFVATLRQLDEGDGARTVPHLDWTAAETAAHMVTVVRRALRDRRRAATLDELAALNATAIDEVAERDPAQLASLLESDLAMLEEVVPRTPEDAVFPLHAGVRADVATGLSYVLCDLLVHAWDIAAAVDRTVPIDPRLAEIAVLTLLPGTRPWIRPGVVAGPVGSISLALRAGEPAMRLTAGDGEFRVEREPGPAPAVDGVETLLAVCGRVPATDPTVARLAAWYLPI